MKMLFENWRGFVNEQAEIIDFPAPKSRGGVKEFELNLDDLNSSIQKITDAAKEVLGAEGEAPILKAEDFQQAAQDLRMVAEQEGLTPEEEKEAERLGLTPELYMLGKQSDDPEYLKLRRRYFGPEGEMARAKAMGKERGVYGAKKSNLLDTGLGRMTAADFEKARIVMPVSQEVLDTFQDMVQQLKSAGSVYEEAKSWYHNIRKLMDEATSTRDEDGNIVSKNDRDATLLGLMIATYSPRAKFALNLAEAVFMYKAVQQDVADGKEEELKDYIHGFPKTIEGNAEFLAKRGLKTKDKGKRYSDFPKLKGVMRGFSGAHKVPNFALNLIAPNLAGGIGPRSPESLVMNEMYEWNSTIDTWMIDAFYPYLRKASTAKEWEKIKGNLMSDVVSYRYMARLVAQEAKKLNILPQELQAIIWVASQIRTTGEEGLGVTTEFAFNQLRSSITEIAKIKNDLETLKSLEEKDWLATFIETIEKQGFEEAARYILEPNVGVRSVTSKGKKGDAFKYFPSKKKKIKEHIDEKGRAYKKSGKKRVYYDPKNYKTLYMNPEFKDLKTWLVVNSVIQMNDGKFSNLHDSILLYLDPDFSTEKAVEFLQGRFDPEAKRGPEYFKEKLDRIAEELRRAR